MDEQGAATLMRELVAAEPPDSRIDVERAIRSAKRRRKRRAGVVLAAAAVVVIALVAGGVPLLRTDSTQHALEPPQQNLSPAFTFNPAYLNIRLDWQPDGVTRVETQTDSQYQSIMLLGPNGSRPIAEVAVWGKGQMLPSDTAAQKADDIYGNGIRSNWKGSGDRSGTLYWFWGPGAFATVRIYDSANPVDLAVRLARVLRTDVRTAVRLPFSVQPPPGRTLARTLTVTGSGGFYAGALDFLGPPSGLVPSDWVTVAATNDPASVSAGRPYAPIGRRMTWDTTDGNPAGVALRPTTTDLVTAGSQTVLSDGTVVRLGASVRLVSGPDDPRLWTPAFLRK